MMSVNEYVLVLVAAAVVVSAILTIGILIAADIIHVGARRTESARESEASAPRRAERSSSAT